jgi:hypothetical protein
MLKEAHIFTRNWKRVPGTRDTFSASEVGLYETNPLVYPVHNVFFRSCRQCRLDPEFWPKLWSIKVLRNQHAHKAPPKTQWDWCI